MDFESLPRFYPDLEKDFIVKNDDLSNATYTSVDSNFVLSSKFARHRWFNYKEGFSPVLVERLFNECQLNSHSFVCDPFCGAGTTLTVAKRWGMHSVGFEVNPFAAFISRIKVDDYQQNDIIVLKELLYQLNKIDPLRNRDYPNNEYILKIFDQEMLRTQLNIKAHLLGLPESKAKKLLFFAWLCTLEECSLYRKAGNGLKKKTKPLDYSSGNSLAFAINAIEKRCKKIIEDFNEEDNGPIPQIYEDSATKLNSYVSDNQLDLVLFSPPYANCFDYTKIYYLELWFGGFISSREEQTSIRMNSIRSHCHATWPERYQHFSLPALNEELLPLLKKQELWTNRIPGMLNGYFADMEEVLKRVYQALTPGGRCMIVVSNSAYAGIVIPTDILLAKIAERAGYYVDEIEVERLIITSSQQYKKTEHVKRYLRESIVKIRK